MYSTLIHSFFVRDFHWVALRRRKFNSKLFLWWHQSTPAVVTCITCAVTLLVLLQLVLTKVFTRYMYLLSKSYSAAQNKFSLNGFWIDQKPVLRIEAIEMLDTILEPFGCCWHPFPIAQCYIFCYTADLLLKETSLIDGEALSCRHLIMLSAAYVRSVIIRHLVILTVKLL